MSSPSMSSSRRTRRFSFGRCYKLWMSTALLAGSCAVAAQTTEPAATASDADLLSISTEALQLNAAYQSAVKAYEAAQELVPQARGRLLPQLSASGAYDWQRQHVEGTLFGFPGVDNTDTFGRYYYGAQLTQAVFKPQLFYGLSTAELKVKQAEYSLSAAQDALLIEVAQTYFGVLGARDALFVAKAKTVAVQEQLDHVKARADAGLATLADVKTAQASYEITAADLADASNTLRAAQMRLEAITGKSYAKLKVLPDEVRLTPPNPLNEQDWVTRAGTQNPSVLAQQAAMEVAKVEARAARGARYPQIDLVGAAYALNSDDSGSGIPGKRREDDERIGLRMNVPLFSGGTVSATIRQADVLKEKAVSDVEATRARVTRDTRIAYLIASTGLTRVQALKRAVEAAVDAEQSARAGYESGTRNNTDVLDAVEKRYGAERDYAAARYQFLINSLRLKQQAGNLLTADLAQINQLLQDSMLPLAQVP
ncbi:outer membrane protein [Solimonas aquatica]|uniref:Outer membrane protein n=2 Tax=Solimonas aquatica TaxID=489703 RepID=A0A1H9CXX8_9GAMM|nr:outer membrane protein [Solimonas aquatica]